MESVVGVHGQGDVEAEFSEAFDVVLSGLFLVPGCVEVGTEVGVRPIVGENVKDHDEDLPSEGDDRFGATDAGLKAKKASSKKAVLLAGSCPGNLHADTFEMAVALADPDAATFVGTDGVAWGESSDGGQVTIVAVHGHIDTGFGEQGDGGKRIDARDGIELGDGVLVRVGQFGELVLDMGDLGVDHVVGL